jgi:hypothetical protein
MGFVPPYVLYAIFQLTAIYTILFNLLTSGRVGFTPSGKYFLYATLFAAAGVAYAMVALAFVRYPPRLLQDLCVFMGVFMLGISVARYQSLVERRNTMQDFPLTGLAVLLLTAAYIAVALRLEFPPRQIAYVAAFAVLSLGFYDLVREFLERMRKRRESTFRKQLRLLANQSSEETLRLRLQEGLELLCRTMDASGGFIAIRSGEEFVVAASMQSVSLEKRFEAQLLSYDDVTCVQSERIPGIQYAAPSFDGQVQIAVLGIGRPNNHLDYSLGELDLLSEVADQIGTVVSLSSVQPQVSRILSQSASNEDEARVVASQMLHTMEVHPDQEFVRMVEECLRQLSDYIALGQSALADKLGVTGDSHIERGRILQTILTEAIELLRPSDKRPPQPLPRVWYNHAVLHDAYVEGIPNREIMARLYISEGTFNRTRRNAIRGLARSLMEKHVMAPNR